MRIFGEEEEKEKKDFNQVWWVLRSRSASNKTRDYCRFELPSRELQNNGTNNASRLLVFSRV